MKPRVSYEVVNKLISVYSIVYDKYRNRCASGSMDNTVKLWDIATGDCLQTFTGHTSLVGLLGMSPNNIVSAAADHSLRVWDANTQELKHILSSHAAAITCFQHDETKVVSGSDGTLKLWDIRTGRFIADLLTGITSVWQVSFHGGLLVAASQRDNNTVFDVFDFGSDADPSGIDDPSLDTLRRPAWARGNPREPHTYQVDDSDSDDDPVWIDVGGMSPETVERWKGLRVQPQARADARGPSISDGSTPLGNRVVQRRGTASRSRQIHSEPGDERPSWAGEEENQGDLVPYVWPQNAPNEAGSSRASERARPSSRPPRRSRRKEAEVDADEDVFMDE